MANFTSNYNLKKPLPEEFYNIEDHNGNMDIIDAQLKQLSDNGGSVKSVNGQTGNVVLSASDLNVYSKSETDDLLTNHTHDLSSLGAAPVNHSHSVNDITSGTLPVARGGTGGTTPETARNAIGAAPMYTYSSTDIVAGSTALETGKLYFVYE